MQRCAVALQQLSLLFCWEHYMTFWLYCLIMSELRVYNERIHSVILCTNDSELRRYVRTDFLRRRRQRCWCDLSHYVHRHPMLPSWKKNSRQQYLVGSDVFQTQLYLWVKGRNAQSNRCITFVCQFVHTGKIAGWLHDGYLRLEATDVKNV